MKKGDKELQPGVPLQGRELAGQAGDGSHVCWGQGVVHGPRCALPHYGTLKSAFSFLSLEVLPTANMGSGELNNYHESVQTGVCR